MSDKIRLETDAIVVEIVPRLGGSLAAFAWKDRGRLVPLFRPWDGATENPRALSSSPMVPWFNRISGGGINFGGKFYPIEPNDPMDEFPLHGDGWHAPWEVAEERPDGVTLKLRSRAIPPFDYEATQVISVAGPTLDIVLSLRHCGQTPLPYGLGHHPWYVRTPDVTLSAKATGMWLEQPPAFPPKTEPAAIPEKWDFNTPHPLPEDFIDNGYAGWDGRGIVTWPARGIAVDVEADSATRYYHVYSLGKDCPIFCFEPVTHPNNAYAKPGTPEANGLRVLAPGATTSMQVKFTAKPL
jgi:aldose 1-epimerase